MQQNVSACIQNHTHKHLYTRSHVFRLIRGSNCRLFTLVWVLCCALCVEGQITSWCLLLWVQNTKCQQWSPPGAYALTCHVCQTEPTPPMGLLRKIKKRFGESWSCRAEEHNATVTSEKVVKVVESNKIRERGIWGKKQVGEMGVRNKGDKRKGEEKKWTGTLQSVSVTYIGASLWGMALQFNRCMCVCVQ